jgi:hypothetical protein
MASPRRRRAAGAAVLGALALLLAALSPARAAYVIQRDNLRIRAPATLRGDYEAAVGDVRAPAAAVECVCCGACCSTHVQG